MTDRDLTLPLVHLHRGELSRMTAYRQRLDATTHMAVVTAAALVTFVLGRDELPPYVLGLGVLLEAGFILLEATRYRRFELVKSRVRMLETGFYAGLLGGEDPGWKERLRVSLERPRPSIGLASAIGIRLRVAHLWVLYVYAAAWGLAVLEHPGSWTASAAVGPLPGWLSLSVVISGLLASTAWALRRGPELDA